MAISRFTAVFCGMILAALVGLCDSAARGDYMLGDTNEDGAVNLMDVNFIVANLTDGNLAHGPMPYLASCDVDNSGVVDGIVHPGNMLWNTDVDYELHYYLRLFRGDLNGDTKVGFSDFQIMLNHWQETTLYTSGDANCDGVVNFEDLQTLINDWNPAGGYPATPAPEPATLAILAMGALGLTRRLVRRR